MATTTTTTTTITTMKTKTLTPTTAHNATALRIASSGQLAGLRMALLHPTSARPAALVAILSLAWWCAYASACVLGAAALYVGTTGAAAAAVTCDESSIVVFMAMTTMKECAVVV
jgi:hypothetical protein